MIGNIQKQEKNKIDKISKIVCVKEPFAGESIAMICSSIQMESEYFRKSCCRQFMIFVATSKDTMCLSKIYYKHKDRRRRNGNHRNHKI